MVQAQPDLQVLQGQLDQTVVTEQKEPLVQLVVQAQQDKRELQVLQDLQVVMVLTGLKVKKVR